MSVLCRRALGAAAVAILSARPGGALAQGYPAQPVRVIVPFGPGGPADLLARLLAQKLAERFGRPFPVENIGGAGGNIGVGRAARAAGDGHTLLVTAPNYVINPSLFERVPYDALADFTPVTIAATAPTILTVHPSIPAADVPALVALIRAHPGRYAYASPGIGTPPHLLGEMFRLAYALDLVHAPFNSGGLAINATIAGHAPISFGALPAAVPHVAEGRLKAIALTSARRAPALPGVPTMAEAGQPDIAADIWSAVLAPAGTPAEITALLQAEIARIVALPDVSTRLDALGYAPLANTPAESAAQIRAELTKWADVIRQAGIRAQ